MVKTLSNMKKLIFFLLLIISLKSFSQTSNSSVDTYSKISCYVDIFHENKLLGNATGFFFTTKTKVYFITNNHVVGGKFYKDEYLRDHKHVVPLDSIPNKIKIKVYGARLNQSFFITVPLINNHDTAYIKFNNATYKNDDLMDVVAIPINDAIKLQIKNTVVLRPQDINPNIVMSPSTELFIVGFPYDYGKFNTYPIWKRGTIASEPNLKSINVNNFWIDATTRMGMSGSPVYFRGSIYATKESPTTIDGKINTFLIGIYSAQNYFEELGVVWDLSKVVDELNKLDQ